MKPIAISDLEIVFPATISHLLPKWEDIPKEFWDRNDKGKWSKVVSDWFFRGLVDAKWKPKEGIDTNLALRHLQAIMGSFQPKHEHKEAGVAYLMSQWFDDVEYTPGEPEWMKKVKESLPPTPTKEA